MFCSRTALRPDVDGTFDWYDATAEATGYTTKTEKHPTPATAGTKEGSVPWGAIEAPNDNHPGVTLDHSAFPHIFENIYNNTEGPRTHFRGLASFFHRKTDKDNLRHLALASSGDSKGIALLGGENKGALSVRDAFNTSWGFRKSAYLYYVDLRSRSPVLHRAPMRTVNLPGNTMAVDIVGCPPLPSFKSTIRNGKTPVQLEIVRAIPTPSTWGVQEESSQEPSVNRLAGIVKAHTLVLFTRPHGPLLNFRPKHPSGFRERRLVVNIGPPVDVDSLNWYGGSSAGSSNHIFRKPKRVTRELYEGREVYKCAPPSDIPQNVVERIYIFDRAWTQWQLNNLCGGGGGGALGFIIESITQQIMKVFYKSPVPFKPWWILVGAELLSGAVIGTHDPFSGHPLDSYSNDLYRRLYAPLCKPDPHLSSEQDRQYAENKQRIVTAVAFMVMHCMGIYTLEGWIRAAELIIMVVHFRTVEEHCLKIGQRRWELEGVGYPWHTQTKEQMTAKP